MRVRYTAGAAEDLTGIAEYLNSRNPAAAAKVGAELRAAMRTIGKHPFSGRAQNVRGVRKVEVDQYGYLVFYTIVEAESVTDILAVQQPVQDRSYADD